MAIFYEDPDTVFYLRKRSSPSQSTRAWPSYRGLDQVLTASGLYDDSPDGAFYAKRRYNPNTPARRAFTPAYREMESLLAADAWNVDPDQWFYVKPKHPVPPVPKPIPGLIPTILNLGQLQLQLNTLFAQLPEFGSTLPAASGYYDGKLFSLGASAVYQVQNGGWVRLI